MASCSPEYSTIQAHIADINRSIAVATADPLVPYANELFQVRLITMISYRSAITGGRDPFLVITNLTAEAMEYIKNSPQLFDTLVRIIEKSDRELASILRRECCEFESVSNQVTITFH